MIFGGDTPEEGLTRPRQVFINITIRSGFGYGNGRNSTALTTENTAVFAPTPNASVTMIAAANPGLRLNVRETYRMSCATSARIVSIAWPSCVSSIVRAIAGRIASKIEKNGLACLHCPPVLHI
ncbi:MAG: hypothetical protein AUH43_06055 [Acidobacteria bacterium 13_1_40CM_65_14]|nr:MAG: hypothetical protein AUH43_06055 [Acidobacteria bacterium 13_1_40CM_65_14]